MRASIRSILVGVCAVVSFCAVARAEDDPIVPIVPSSGAAVTEAAKTAPQPAAAAALPAVATKQNVIEPTAVLFDKKGRFLYPKENDRDPFDSFVDNTGALSVRMVRQEGDLKLTGIVHGEGSPDVAVINNEVFYEGDMIGMCQLKKISEDRVVLKTDDKDIELVLEDIIYVNKPAPANGGKNANK